MTDLLALLGEFYRDKLAQLLEHQAGARLIGQYDVNNTYQYVINREDVQLSWIASAIGELGGTISDQAEPDRGAASGTKGRDRARQVLQEDRDGAQAFVDRWAPRVEGMRNARHARMLRLILGETLEQKRFFEQALAGQTDLLGRREAQLGPSHGEVLPTRWIE